jgi:hypothetical protein
LIDAVEAVKYYLEKIPQVRSGAEGDRAEYEAALERLRRTEDLAMELHNSAMAALELVGKEVQGGGTGTIEEAARISDEATAASKAHIEARHAVAKIGKSQRELASLLEVLSDAEREARELIAKFRKNGWLVPELPEETRYLLSEGEGKSKPPRKWRRQRS